MSTNNRIIANLWRMANVDGNFSPTGLKNVSTGAGAPPTTAIVAWPAFYVNTSNNTAYYTATGPTPAWVALASSATPGSNVVNGPAVSVVNNIPIFSNVTGNAVIDSGKMLPTGAVVGTTDVQILTNKTLTSPTINTPIISAPNITGQLGVGMSNTVGTAGQVLASNGPGNPISWINQAAAGAAAQTLDFGTFLMPNANGLDMGSI